MREMPLWLPSCLLAGRGVNYVHGWDGKPASAGLSLACNSPHAAPGFYGKKGAAVSARRQSSTVMVQWNGMPSLAITQQVFSEWSARNIAGINNLQILQGKERACDCVWEASKNAIIHSHQYGKLFYCCTLKNEICMLPYTFHLYSSHQFYVFLAHFYTFLTPYNQKHTHTPISQNTLGHPKLYHEMKLIHWNISLFKNVGKFKINSLTSHYKKRWKAIYLVCSMPIRVVDNFTDSFPIMQQRQREESRLPGKFGKK